MALTNMFMMRLVNLLIHFVFTFSLSSRQTLDNYCIFVFNWQNSERVFCKESNEMSDTDTPVHSRRDTPVLHSRRDVVVGESVELVCNTSLTPDIMWTYDTDDGYVDYVYWNAHSHKPRIAVKFIAVGFHSLVVSDAQLNDSGLYGCYDGKGTRKVGYQLTVAGTRCVSCDAVVN